MVIFFTDFDKLYQLLLWGKKSREMGTHKIWPSNQVIREPEQLKNVGSIIDLIETKGGVLRSTKYKGKVLFYLGKIQPH